MTRIFPTYVLIYLMNRFYDMKIMEPAASEDRSVDLVLQRFNREELEYYYHSFYKERYAHESGASGSSSGAVVNILDEEKERMSQLKPPVKAPPPVSGRNPPIIAAEAEDLRVHFNKARKGHFHPLDIPAKVVMARQGAYPCGPRVSQKQRQQLVEKERKSRLVYQGNAEAKGSKVIPQASERTESDARGEGESMPNLIPPEAERTESDARAEEELMDLSSDSGDFEPLPDDEWSFPCSAIFPCNPKDESLMRKRTEAFTLSWPAQRQKVAEAIDHGRTDFLLSTRRGRRHSSRGYADDDEDLPQAVSPPSRPFTGRHPHRLPPSPRLRSGSA